MFNVLEIDLAIKKFYYCFQPPPRGKRNQIIIFPLPDGIRMQLRVDILSNIIV